MTRNRFCLIAGIIFGIVCLVQLTRIVAGWEVIINGSVIPAWPSVVAVIVTGILSFFGLRYGLTKNEMKKIPTVL